MVPPMNWDWETRSDLFTFRYPTYYFYVRQCITFIVKGEDSKLHSRANISDKGNEEEKEIRRQIIGEVFVEKVGLEMGPVGIVEFTLRGQGWGESGGHGQELCLNRC